MPPVPFRAPSCVELLLLGLAVAAGAAEGDAGGAPWRAAEDAQWRPLALEWDVEPGSALDCSHLLDPPAGRHGRVVVRDGHFAFAGRPGRVRLHGNHVGLEGISAAGCERLAERLARLGCNLARIHVYDQDLQGKGADSTALDPAQLDLLDRLFAACKRRGIYLTIDLYVARVLAAGEVAEWPRPMQHGFKLAAHLTAGGDRNWRRFAAALLEHRNPYTGLAWKDDPALATISLLNEDTPYEQIALTPDIWDGLLRAEVAPAPGEPATAAVRRHLTERVGASYRAKMDWLRRCGVQQPLSGVNYREFVFQTLLRAPLDYVDAHCYYDHPVPVEGAGRRTWVDTPLRYRMKLVEEDAASLPRTAMPVRIPGRPFTLSEWSIPYPSPGRASAGLFAAAYALLQDWDGICRLKYAANPWRMDGPPAPVSGFMGEVFATSGDPIALLSDRIAALLFLRAQAAPARRSFACAVDGASHGLPGDGGYDPGFEALGLVARIGSLPIPGPTHGHDAVLWSPALVGAPPPAGAVPWSGRDPFTALVAAGRLDLDDVRRAGAGRFRSDTGELDLDCARARFALATPGAAAVSGRLDGGHRAGPLAVEGCTGYALAFATALDAPVLARSRRVLVLFLTDALASGAAFADRERTLYTAHGHAPLLVRAASARIALAGCAVQRVHALDLAGRRIAELPVEHGAGVLSFTASTAGAHPALAYELSAGP
ncbi:MAG: hypothetical protein L6R48_11035 [Planctomycetes bacterium]|nr:hypothetical protein [Planctomycetota bacterium]